MFFKGLTVPELALNIMELLSAKPSRATLESDVVDLCGFQYMDFITTILLHRQELVASFLVCQIIYIPLSIPLHLLLLFF